MLKVKGRRTIENTLRPYDEAMLQVDSVDSEGWVIAAVHPDAALRAVAEKTRQKAESFSTALLLNREAYIALSGADLREADPETRYYLEKTLRAFRLAGVEKSPEVQAKIKALREELVSLGQEFSRNIQNDSRTVAVSSVSELEGLPQDYIARHVPDASGKITLTTDSSDVFPLLSYAKSDDLRRRMYIEYRNRAYPMNMAVLDRMLARRYELASLLGFSSWADYVTADKMVKSARNASDFLDQIADASRERADREYQALLKRKQQVFPGATCINTWEVDYWSEKVKNSEYDFDTQQLRSYFPYKQVKQGIFNLIGKMFGVTFRQLKDTPVWHPSVECWDMLEDGKLVGRFYLDMHPRPNKSTNGVHFPVRTGVAGRQIPESVLVCNFPGYIEGDPGLMEYDDVQTFFHEFGHLVHNLFAGSQRWLGTGGTRAEYDFLEAPSQMLEEWISDPSALHTFAKHYQTGEPVPDQLLQKMKKAKEFGKGTYVRSQVVFAKIALSLHDRHPSQINTDQLVRTLTNKYGSFPFVEGTHYQCSFTHLDSYSALVYTYLWSLVIAKDLFSQFDRANLLDPDKAKRYRDTVLVPGGSAPASTLIENFLGRPFNFKAWQAWLNGD